MSLATYASEFNKENMENPIQKKRANMRNKTLKRPSNHNNGPTKSNANVEALMQKIHNNGGDYGGDDDDDDDEMSGNFHSMESNNDSYTKNNEIHDSLANNIEKEGFTQLPSEYAKQYYQQYIPYYNQSSDDLTPNGANKDELLNKLNQVIYLLEEQQDEKTGRVTEELILYSFLGIFIIFIVDSFARVGKYVR
jgi:hypothetical protein